MFVMTRTIRVYVCSLVSDTLGERAVLEAAVFPQLRERLASHGVALEVVFAGLDVQAGDTTPGDILASDFKAIDECRPFFVAILGERYGCPPDAIPTGLLREQRWILDYAERSTLELEIQHGVLNDPQAARGGFFYLREPRTIFAVPESDRASLLEDNPESAQRLADLKERIRRSGRPIMDNYPCRWDADSRQMGELDAFAERVRSDLSEAIAGELPELAACLVSTVAPPEPAPAMKADKPHYVDEDVQFTVFRPKTVRPEEWYDLVAAAHLEEKRETAPEDEPEPLEKVRRKAKKILGAQMADYKEVSRDSTQSVPQGGEITFLFEMDQVEFNPARCTFQWLEDEHTVDVRIRASRALDGQTATGQMSVFLGAILLADVPLKIKVDSRFVPKAETPDPEPVSARPYRKIFASYSHQDLMIVEQFERFAEALGDRYLRDWKDLRAGENWDSRLMQLIDEADVFQLFWSCHSMESEFVRREWEYALKVPKPNFVRPVYWEQPFPRRPDLPTDDLGRLHFQQLASGGPPHLPAASEVSAARPPASGTPDSNWTMSEAEDDFLEENDRSSLSSPSDSGLNLQEEPLDLAGSSLEDEELLEEPEAEPEAAAPVLADEDTQLSPSAALQEDEEDSGSQVIALEDSSAFGMPVDGGLLDAKASLDEQARADEIAGVLEEREAAPVTLPTLQLPAHDPIRSSNRDWIYVLATAAVAVSVLALLAWLFIFRTAKKPSTPQAAEQPASVLEQPKLAPPSSTTESIPGPLKEAALSPKTTVQEEPPLASLTSISAAVGDTSTYRRELRAYVDRHPGSKRSEDYQRTLDGQLPLLDQLAKWQDMLDRWSTLDMRVVAPNQAASMVAEAKPFLQGFADLPQLDQVRERLLFLQAIADRVDAQRQSIVAPLIERFQDPALAVVAPGAVETLSKLEDRTWESTFFRVLQAVAQHPQLAPSRRLQAMHDVLQVAARGSLPMRNGFSPQLAMLADFSQTPGSAVPASAVADDATYQSRCAATLATLPSLTPAAQQAAAQYHSLQSFPRGASLSWAGWLGRDEQDAWQCLLNPQASPTSGRLVVFHRTAPATAWSMTQVGALADATPTFAPDRPEMFVEGLPVLCETASTAEPANPKP